MNGISVDISILKRAWCCAVALQRSRVQGPTLCRRQPAPPVPQQWGQGRSLALSGRRHGSVGVWGGREKMRGGTVGAHVLD